MMMRRMMLCGLAVVLACGPAGFSQDAARATATGPATAAPNALPADASVDQTLDALDAVGRELKSFTAGVKLSEKDEIAQDTVVRTGKFIYQALGVGDSRLRVTFDTRIQDGAAQPQKIEYLLDKGWLIDRNYGRKIEVNRQMRRPGEKIDLMKLGEGPFPLPIGQKKEDVHKQFDVKRVELAEGELKGAIHLELTPLPGTRFERDFATIDVWVDQNSHMPVRIETEDKNQTTVRTTDLSDVKLGAQLSDADFKLPDIPASEWQRRDEPFGK
jgi:outer membrane lipoprotein-sorting protein